MIKINYPRIYTYIAMSLSLANWWAYKFHATYAGKNKSKAEMSAVATVNKVCCCLGVLGTPVHYLKTY